MSKERNASLARDRAPDTDDLEDICGRLEGELASMAGGRVLITGGAGFLGYYLVRTLLHHNRSGRGPAIDVLVLDNFMRGRPDWFDDLEPDPHLRLADHDVKQPLPEDLPPADFIVHAASIASPSFYRSRPIETMDANVRGVRHLLDHCQQRAEPGAPGPPVRAFLFFSSSEIYGDPTPDAIPTPESYPGRVSCTGPRACYDESKRYGETLCVNFHRRFGLPIKIARPFNNYGPGLKITDRRLLADFARCVLAGEDIVMHSDGSPTRTFCYIADAVVGYYQVLLGGRPGEAYNIGADRPEIPVREVADRVTKLARELFDYRGRVIHQASDESDYLVDNPQRRCPNIDKARAELGFEPRVSLDEGLRKTLLWYKHNPTAVDA
ncbi:MAG: NAD-dependent epimerase/dehydratase family protein [Acidobacteriota bacterium]